VSTASFNDLGALFAPSLFHNMQGVLNFLTEKKQALLNQNRRWQQQRLSPPSTIRNPPSPQKRKTTSGYEEAFKSIS